MVAVFAVVFALAGVVAGVKATSAFAWTYQVSGSAACNTTTGKYDVTWTIDNSTENEAFTVTASNRAAVPVGSKVAAFSSRSFADHLPGSTTGTTTLSVDGNWPSDTNSHPMSASVVTAGTCKQTKPKCKVNCTPPPPAPADLGITKVADKSTYNIGDAVTFTLVVTNHGPGAAYGVAVDDPGKPAMTGNPSLPGTLPANLNSYAITTTQGSCTLGGSVGSQYARCLLGDIPNGGTVTLTVKATAAAAGTAINSACVGTDKTADQAEGNNCATVTITVSSPPAPAPAPSPAPKPAPKPKPHKPVVHKKPKPHKPVVHKKHHPKPPKQPKYTP